MYIAPLTSDKNKKLENKQMNDSFYKIITKDNGYLGSININNMIPVKAENIFKVNINEIDNCKYKRLLKKQIKAINLDAKAIKNKASRFYEKTHKHFIKISFDFKLLENQCLKYNQKFQTLESRLNFIKNPI